MTALDRAFIKAYASRRSLRGAGGNSAALGEFEASGISYRIDRAHGASPAPIAAGHTKPAARKPGRPSNENVATLPGSAETTAEPPEASETVVRKQRLVISVNDAVPTTDWIWQREPSPVFAHQASTADPLPAPSPGKRPADKPPSGRLFTREILSLGLSDSSAALSPAPQFAVISQPAVAATPAPPIAAPAVQAMPAAPALAPQTISIPPAPSLFNSFNPAAASVAAPVAAPATAAAALASPAQSPAEIAQPASAATASSPLSSFTIMPRVEDRLQPALEVDHFLWPAECSKLVESAGGAMEKFARRLLEAARCGQRRVALVGLSAGAGTSSVALCLARMAAERESWWGLVDADFAHARLARQLGIADTGGWQGVVAGRDRLADISIASIDDHLILVPLSGEKIDQRELAGSFRLPVMFSMLSESVDLVLVDAGAATTAATDSLTALVRSAKIDAVYLVFDHRRAQPAEVTAGAHRLQALGINVAGAIANFAA